jgi:hypothetical protein
MLIDEYDPDQRHIHRQGPQAEAPQGLTHRLPPSMPHHVHQERSPVTTARTNATMKACGGSTDHDQPQQRCE